MYISVSIAIIFINMFLFITIANNMSKYGITKLLVATTSLIMWIVCDLMSYVTTNIVILKYSTFFMFFFVLLFSGFIALGTLEIAKKKKYNVKVFLLFLIVPVIFIILSIISIYRPYIFKFNELNSGKVVITGFMYPFFEVYAYFMGIFAIFNIARMEKTKNKIFRINSIFIGFCMLVLITYNQFMGKLINVPLKIDLLPLLLTFACISFISVLDTYTYNTIVIEIIDKIVDDLGSLIIAYDKNGVIVYINNVMVNFLSLKESDLIGISVFNKDACKNKFPDNLYNTLTKPKNDEYLDLGTNKYRTNIEKKDIGKNDYLTTIVFSDVTKEVDFQNKLSKLSKTDSLTGLGNRRMYEEDAIYFDKKYQNNIIIVSADLDNLKITNDIFGHLAGDNLLVDFVNILKESFINPLGMYRLGGDEFCVVLGGVNFDTVKSYIDNLYILASKFNSSNYYQLLFSLGCAEKGNLGYSIDEIHKFADVSMFRSKKQGKNKVTYFSEEIYDNFVMQNELKNDIHDSFVNNDFSIYLQPVFNSKNKNITNCEVLARWNHKKYGILRPSEFISVIKELNLSTEIDYFVFEKTCALINKWDNQNIQMQININVETLAQDNCLEKISSIVNKYNISPSLIVFEIKEDARLNEIDVVKKNIAKIRDFGIRFAIDKYGKGFSDFMSLKEFKPDYIKIDKSLIQIISDDTKKKENTALMVAFIKTFGCKIIAVGVETIEQRDILLDLKVEYLQGYLYGNVVTIEEYEKLFLE